MAERELQVGDRVEGQFGPGAKRKGKLDLIEYVADVDTGQPTAERTGMGIVLVDGRGRVRGLLSSLTYLPNG